MDAAYAVHPSMRGHTAVTVSIAECSVYSNSMKQKLVARGLTEAELIGVHDELPQILWAQNFL